MASTGVKLGYGTTVRIGRGTGPTVYTALTGFDTLTFPDQSPDDVDVTHSTSPGRTEESIPGLFKAADWQLTKHYVPGDAQDVLLSDLDDTKRDGDAELILLEITPTGGTAQEWQGYVKSWIPTLPTKTQMMATLTLRVMAKVVA